MTGRFSEPPFEQLLTTLIDLCGLIVPAGSSPAKNYPHQLSPPQPIPTDLPLINPYLEQNIIHHAWASHVPVWEVDSLKTPETLALLTNLKPDLIVVVCFPHIFPKELLQLSRYGCLNLHPSLLPQYRGPTPLFWIARQDERTTGVTLHYMTEKLDSGDIVAQTRIDRSEGISEAELEQRCALEGAALLGEAVQQLSRGESLSRRPQSEAKASYYPYPSRHDFQIPLTWSAQRAFNFAHSAELWPLFISVENIDFYIQEVLSYQQEQVLGQPYKISGNELWVQFQPGVLQAKIRYESSSNYT